MNPSLTMHPATYDVSSILLVEDDPDDGALFTECLGSIHPACRLQWLSRCEPVMEALDRNPPDLVFLDINLPGADGFECLKSIFDHPRHRYMPVVMYSSSPNPRDIYISYGLGATLYLQKPSSYRGIEEALKSILSMAWFTPGAVTAQHYVDGRYVAYGKNN
ncbi:MAG TPA: response regulator [Chitinophagaceae bacterium]|jgi:DNA-binding response OmpR family regulator|nr:response regulator [Chitinophagaceae bacterium]